MSRPQPGQDRHGMPTGSGLCFENTSATHQNGVCAGRSLISSGRLRLPLLWFLRAGQLSVAIPHRVVAVSTEPVAASLSTCQSSRWLRDVGDRHPARSDPRVCASQPDAFSVMAGRENLAALAEGCAGLRAELCENRVGTLIGLIQRRT